MFKACFHNFIRNLKYVFVEVGFMYLALLFGFDIFIRQVGIGFEQFKAALTQIVDTGNTDLFMEGVQEIVARVSTGVIGFVAVQIIGLILGYILIMLMIRTDIEKRNIFKVLLSAIIDGAILVVYIIVIISLLNVAPWADIIVLLLFLPFFSVVTLLGTYLNHGLRLVGIKRIITVKNVVKLATANLLTIVAILALGYLSALIFNAIIGLTLTVALFIIGIATISLNADSYMNSVIEEAKTNKMLEEAIEAAKSEKYTTFAEIQSARQPQVNEQLKVEEVKDEAKAEEPKVEEQPKVEEVKAEEVKEEKKEKDPKKAKPKAKKNNIY